jgi:hypothetical protein
MTHKIPLLLFCLTLSLLSQLRADDVNPIISVTSPDYGSDISGSTDIKVVAPGMTTVTVKCWQAGGDLGTDSTVGSISLDPDGKGSITFPADKYPHGPLTIRILGQAGDKIDHCYLQVYNKTGTPWNEGIPKSAPPAAEGMKLLFSDDFDGPLSISDDPKAKYYDHKVPNGSQDFSSIPFTSFDSPNNPFSQVDTYLRIRADSHKNSTGLISSLKNDATGFKASIPCYFECRFLAPNEKGTWPAFWLLTDYMTDFKAGKDQNSEPVDELDIIEAVGGEGPGEPNGNSDPKNGDLYQITPHAWNQPDMKDTQDKAYKDMHDPISMSKAGVPSSWFESFHTYGCKVTDTDTIYYLDNIEVARHATFPASKKYPLFFLINLATGSGWPVDLSRYNGIADMYVDWVRVYGNDTPLKQP